MPLGGKAIGATMKYWFEFFRDKRGGYWGKFPDLPGCQTQADSISGLKKAAQEALEIYFDDEYDFQCKIPLPKTRKSKNGFCVLVDSSIAFPVLLRKLRLAAGFTQQEMAEKLGLKSVGAYQRLETLQKSNPRLTTVHKIAQIFGDDFSDILKKSAA